MNRTRGLVVRGSEVEYGGEISGDYVMVWE